MLVLVLVLLVAEMVARWGTMCLEKRTRRDRAGEKKVARIRTRAEVSSSSRDRV